MTFVMRSSAEFIRIIQPDSFVHDLTTEDLYFPDECYRQAPKVCWLGVKYDKRQQSCLHGLITQDQDQLQQCPVTLFSKAHPQRKL